MTTIEEFQDRFGFLLAHKIRTAIVDERWVKHPFDTGWLRAHWVIVKLPIGDWMTGNNVFYGPFVEGATDFVFITITHVQELMQEVAVDMGIAA